MIAVFFGMPGRIELVIIGILCMATLVVPLAILIVVLFLINRGNRDDEKP